MIRPNLMTAISSEESPMPHIQANANNIVKDQLDCGITALGCCNTPTCQKLGNTKVFLVLFSLTGIFQGAAQSFFRVTARQAAVEHDYNPALVDWILVASGIMQGMFALIIVYWANRVHKASWLGGLIIFQAITTVLSIIPSLAQNNQEDSISRFEISVLCTSEQRDNLTIESTLGYMTIVVLFILQAGIALGNIAFYCLGITYMDDNTKEINSPALIGTALAARYWGVQWGSGLAIGNEASPFGWWLGWSILGPSLLILGILLSMFPRQMLKTIVTRAVVNIIETATNVGDQSTNRFIADVSFGNSFCRLLKNKILMFNILAAMFIETAVVNFFFFEHDYLRAVFFLPTDEFNGLNNEWTSQIITRLLKPPIVALTILVAGLVIAKARPSARKLAMWNVITALIVALFFVAYIFINCPSIQLAGSYRSSLTTPMCSNNCMCESTVMFMPVCPQDSVFTYYSPCHAGCHSEEYINDIRIFQNCSCGVDIMYPLRELGTATEGACGFGDCQVFWIVFQVLTVVGAALLGSGLVGNILISIRSVLPQDKALALSTELTVLGLIVYIPGKISYQSLADLSCQYWSLNGEVCHLHDTSNFGILLNIVTASLIAIGVVFDFLVFLFVGNLTLYQKQTEEEDDRMLQLQSMSSINRRSPRNNHVRFNDDTEANDEIQQQSLLLGRYEEPNSGDLIHSIQNSHNNYRQSHGSIEFTEVPRDSMFDAQNQPIAGPSRTTVTMSKIPEDEIDFKPRTAINDDDGWREMTASPASSSRTASPNIKMKTSRPMSPETNF